MLKVPSALGHQSIVSVLIKLVAGVSTLTVRLVQLLQPVANKRSLGKVALGYVGL